MIFVNNNEVKMQIPGQFNLFSNVDTSNLPMFHRYLKGALCQQYNGAQGFHFTPLLSHSVQFEMPKASYVLTPM